MGIIFIKGKKIVLTKNELIFTILVEETLKNIHTLKIYILSIIINIHALTI